MKINFSIIVIETNCHSKSLTTHLVTLLKMAQSSNHANHLSRGSKRSHAVVIIWAVNIYSDTLTYQANWSGGITEVVARPHAGPYMGVFVFFTIGVSVRLSDRSLHREEQKKIAPSGDWNQDLCIFRPMPYWVRQESVGQEISEVSFVCFMHHFTCWTLFISGINSAWQFTECWLSSVGNAYREKLKWPISRPQSDTIHQTGHLVPATLTRPTSITGRVQSEVQPSYLAKKF